MDNKTLTIATAAEFILPAIKSLPKNYSDSNNYVSLVNKFGQKFWDNEVSAGRTNGIMVRTPFEMRGSNFGNTNQPNPALNPVTSSFQLGLNKNKKTLLELGQQHQNHGHFSSGRIP